MRISAILSNKTVTGRPQREWGITELAILYLKPENSP